MKSLGIDQASMRQESMRIAESLGLPVNPHLPRLEEPRTRTLSEILGRTLCLHLVVACAHGLPVERAEAWLRREQQFENLAPSELAFLQGSRDQSAKASFMWFASSLHTAAWCLSLIDDFDHDPDSCPNDLVHKFPNLLIDESSEAFCARVTLRSPEELFRCSDVLYCLHWGSREMRLRDQSRRDLAVAEVTFETRRRFIDWTLSPDDWDEIAMDT